MIRLTHDEEVQLVDNLIDDLSREQIKQLIHTIIGFSCVPRRVNKSRWCSGHCATCWIEYLQWLHDKGDRR